MQQPADGITRLVFGFTACTIVAALIATPLLGIWPALVVVGTAVAISCTCKVARKKGDFAVRNCKAAKSTPRRSRNSRAW